MRTIADARVLDQSNGSPDPPPFGLTGGRKWLVFFAGWTLLGAFGATRLYYTYNFSSPGLVSWTQVFALALTDWYLWGALSPLVFRLAGRFPFHRGDWIRQILLHLVLAMGFGLVQVTLYSLLFIPVRGMFDIGLATSHQTFAPIWIELLVGKLYVAMITYLLIAFVSHAIHYYRRFRNEQQRLSRAELNLAAVRLEMLKGQLQPHFLFNTLNAISALVHSDHEAADRMIARLSDLLRMSLEQEQEQFCRLDREMEFVRKYLDIQQVRFADRLSVRIDLPAELAPLRVPALLLQPLVENAVQHGIAPLARAGKVSVEAAVVDGRLLISVADTGPGPADQPDTKSGGRGLRLTRERLQVLYVDDFAFSIEAAEDGGTRVAIGLPVQVSDSSGEVR